MVYTSEFPPIYVTVDIVVLTTREDALQVLAIKRAQSLTWGG